MRETTSVIAW